MKPHRALRRTSSEACNTAALLTASGCNGLKSCPDVDNEAPVSRITRTLRMRQNRCELALNAVIQFAYIFSALARQLEADAARGTGYNSKRPYGGVHCKLRGGLDGHCPSRKRAKHRLALSESLQHGVGV